MSFTEKMAVWTLFLEYAKVAFGYSVTIPVLVGFLCWLFRTNIADTFGRLTKASYGKFSVEFAQYTAHAERTLRTIAERPVIRQLTPQEKTAADAVASLSALVARLLPLIPKAERRQFIENVTKTLPEEFGLYRASLFDLAKEAPEVRGVNVVDVIRIGEDVRIQLSGDRPGENLVQPGPKV